METVIILILGLALIVLTPAIAAAVAMFRFAVYRKKKPSGKAYGLQSDEVECYRKFVAEAADKLQALNPEECYIRSDDGLKLKAVLLEAPPDKRPFNGKAGLVLSIHGWRDRGRTRSPNALRYYEAGYSVLMPDLRAHGDSEGKYRDMGMAHLQDLKDWLAFYHERCGLQRDDYVIILEGTSMGAATILSLGGEEDLPANVAAIIEDCGYSRVDRLGSSFVGSLPKVLYDSVLFFTNILCKWKAGFDLRVPKPLLACQNIRVPLMVIHGEKDNFVPFFMSRELYDAAVNSVYKEYWPVAGAVHSYSIIQDPELYFSRIFDFLDKAADLQLKASAEPSVD